MTKAKTTNINKKGTSGKKSGGIKRSIFSEFSAVSGLAALGIIAFIILCVVLYVYMLMPTKKISVVTDDADIFTRNELQDIEDLADKIRKKENLNVVIITTRHKGRGYTDSDEDCQRYAGDYYQKKAVDSVFRDNSGICILVDLTLDYDGGRFFWLYTYGSAYYCIDDDTVTDIFRSHKSQLQAGEYADAIEDILNDAAREHNGGSTGRGFNFWLLIIPAGLAFVAAFIASKGRILDKKPATKEYLKLGETEKYTDQEEDTVTNTRTYVTYASESSGGGGGFSGGGGGFSGGGGHSGGGGGRF